MHILKCTKLKATLEIQNSTEINSKFYSNQLILSLNVRKFNCIQIAQRFKMLCKPKLPTNKISCAFYYKPEILSKDNITVQKICIYVKSLIN